MEMHFTDFMIHADMLKGLRGLISITVLEVPAKSPFWPRLWQVLTPQTHPLLEYIGYYQENARLWERVVLPKAVLAALLQWPSLRELPGWVDTPQCEWNRIRQSKLEDLAVRPLHLRFASPSSDDDEL